ncbi:MAG TPA: PadR family transcriptional regulator [Actinomycetota bacterium]|nr:PadR family transcriptional regulator [Actinomycetota bacterium]
MSKLFGHGDLRLWLLKLLDEEPRHGYDIIAGLEEQFLGVYAPSPGTVYPRLQALEQEGLIEVVREEEGRKVYGLTDDGRAELADRTSEIKELGERLARSAREIARDIREDVKQSVRDIRREILEAARDVRRDERRATRNARQRYKHARDAARDVSSEVKSVIRSLQGDLDGFVADVVSAARGRNLDKERLASLRDAIREARTTILEALEGDEKK